MLAGIIYTKITNYDYPSSTLSNITTNKNNYTDAVNFCNDSCSNNNDCVAFSISKDFSNCSLKKDTTLGVIDNNHDSYLLEPCMYCHKFIYPGVQNTDWKYTNDTDDANCLNNWTIWDSHNNLLNDMIPSITNYNNTKTWCATVNKPKIYDNVIQNYDFAGNDITIIQGNTLLNCQNTCDSISDCSGFTFDNQNNCNIKKILSEGNPTQNINTYPVKDTAITLFQVNNYTNLGNLSYLDSDNIKTYSNSNQALCQNNCNNTLNCIGYTIDNSNNCYLKKAFNNGVRDSNKASYMVPGNLYNNLPQTYYSVSNYDYPDNNIGNPILNTTLSDCKNSCDQSPDCIGISMDNDTKSTCNLKGYLQNGIISNQNSMWIVKGANATGVSGHYYNIPKYDYTDNNLSSLTNQTYNQCQIACDNTPYCAGFTSDGNNCHLKSSMNNGVYSNTYNSNVLIPKNINKKKYTTHNNYNYTGNNILSINNSNDTDCSNACNIINDCVGYSLDGINNCVLRNKLTSGVKVSGTTFNSTMSGKGLPQIYNPSKSNYYFTDNSIGTPVSINNENDCITLCDNTPECVGYNINSYPNLTCDIKSKLDKISYDTNQKYISVTNYNKGYIQLPNYSFSNSSQDIIQNLTNTTLNNCHSACDNNRNCVGFIINNSSQSECSLRSRLQYGNIDNINTTYYVPGTNIVNNIKQPPTVIPQVTKVFNNTSHNFVSKCNL